MSESTEEMKSLPRHRILLVFDFDHTLVDKNTDKHILNLVPDPDWLEGVADLYRENNWIEYMGEIFKHLHTTGKTKEDILQCMDEIPFTEGMTELLQLSRENLDIDCIVISDSNTVFINHILDATKMSKWILKVFTNPAKFDSNGCLTVSNYHTQEFCPLSSVNLCKGDILKRFLHERHASSVEYSSVFYVGDGYNDLCPGLVLREKDCLMPRTGYKLESTIEHMTETNKPANRSDLVAKVVPWATGYDIIKHINSWMEDTLLIGNSHL